MEGVCPCSAPWRLHSGGAVRVGQPRQSADLAGQASEDHLAVRSRRQLRHARVHHSGAAQPKIQPAIFCRESRRERRELRRPIVHTSLHPSLGRRGRSHVANYFGAYSEFLLARHQPFIYLSPGPGTLGQLLAELWGQREDVKLSHVAYKGSGQAINDVIAGHVKMGSITWIGALGAMRGKLVTPIAVSSVERMPEFPDVPTFKELGYPELVASTWFGFAGPAKLPAGNRKRPQSSHRRNPRTCRRCENGSMWRASRSSRCRRRR